MHSSTRESRRLFWTCNIPSSPVLCDICSAKNYLKIFSYLDDKKKIRRNNKVDMNKQARLSWSSELFHLRLGSSIWERKIFVRHAHTQLPRRELINIFVWRKINFFISFFSPLLALAVLVRLGKVVRKNQWIERAWKTFSFTREFIPLRPDLESTRIFLSVNRVRKSNIFVQQLSEWRGRGKR